MTNSTASPRARSIVRVAIAGLAIIAVAGCSSDAKKSDAADAKNLKPVAAVTHQKSATSNPTTASGPACTVEAATAALGTDGTALDITCLDGFAAGAATNTHVDLAYLLQNENGTWTRASDAVQAEVCGPNPQGLPASFVARACDD